MVTIPVLGRVSDIVGRKPVFAGALVVFVIGSVLTARADGLAMLITGRVVQGFGGGALVPVTMALVGDLFPARRRAAIVGLVGAIDTLGWVLGPLYGAALLGITGSWRACSGLMCRSRSHGGGAAASSGAASASPAYGRAWISLGAVLLTLALTGLNLALSSGAEAGSGQRATRQFGESARDLSLAAARGRGSGVRAVSAARVAGTRTARAVAAVPHPCLCRRHRREPARRRGTDRGDGGCAALCLARD